MVDTEYGSAWHWTAVDYGKQAIRSIELASSRGMWADIAFAYMFARKAAHFGAKELQRLDAESRYVTICAWCETTPSPQAHVVYSHGICDAYKTRVEREG